MSVKALVIFEHRQGRPAEVNAEAARLAKELCSGDWAGFFIAGPGDEALAGELAALCPKLYTIIDDRLAAYNPAVWLPALEAGLAELSPQLILMGHTPFGLDLAPALAQALSAPLATDVTAARWRDDVLLVERPVYGGKLTAALALEAGPVRVLTVRPGAFEPIEPGQAGGVVALAAGQGPAALARRFIDYIPAAGGVDLTKAKIIVSVGRGIEGPENIDLAKELAEALGAELGCSRPVADLGWLEKERQVGISGQTVKPKLYLALGISGAYQHQAGMSGAETIIAVNRDAEAPIFDIAHFGVVGDLFDVVPALIDALGG